MRVAVALTSLASITLLASTSLPVHAGVDGKTKPKDATVVLEAGKHSPHQPGLGGPPNSKNGAAPAPVFTPIVACRSDAELGIYGCRTDDPADPEERPDLTPGDVLRAVKEIGLPSLQVRVQPGEETLVNIETIFYADPQPFERSVELLGFAVDLVAEPVSYHWFPGDGTNHVTDKPGRPYPAMDVTHRYATPATDMAARVDVTYQVRFRVDAGPWQTISQTLLASGPAAVLDVKEAAPVLAKP